MYGLLIIVWSSMDGHDQANHFRVYTNITIGILYFRKSYIIKKYA